MKMRCVELFDSSKPFINATGIEYLQEYNENHTEFDMLFLAIRNTDKTVIPVCENEDSRNIIINSVLYLNDYKYRNLYRTTTQQYNPIENYDRMEEGSITDSMTKTGTEQRNGTLSNTRSNTQNLTNTKAGTEKQKTTNNLANTESIGQEKSITENGVKAFNDTDTYADDTKTTTTNNARENSSTATGTVENETTFTGRTDSTTGSLSETENGTTTDTLSFTNRKDENVHSFNNYRVHGNIGITTNAQLLEGERRLSYFAFMEIVYNDIINEITKGVW